MSSWEKVEAWVYPYVGDRPVLLMSGEVSISAAYNHALDHYREHDEIDVVVLLHDDLEVTDPSADQKVLAALSDGADLVGVAGGSARNGLAWWTADPVGHQRIDSGLIDFGTRVGDVDSLEGSFMAFGPWAVEHLRFDEDFTGFHGYDHVGLLARRAEGRVQVVDVDTHHHTQLGFKSSESETAWHTADALFKEKFDL